MQSSPESPRGIVVPGAVPQFRLLREGGHCGQVSVFLLFAQVSVAKTTQVVVSTVVSTVVSIVVSTLVSAVASMVVIWPGEHLLAAAQVSVTKQHRVVVSTVVSIVVSVVVIVAM